MKHRIFGDIAAEAGTDGRHERSRGAQQRTGATGAGREWRLQTKSTKIAKSHKGAVIYKGIAGVHLPSPLAGSEGRVRRHTGRWIGAQCRAG